MRSVEHQEQFAGGLAEVKQIHRCGKAFMAIVPIQLVWGRAWVHACRCMELHFDVECAFGSIQLWVCSVYTGREYLGAAIWLYDT